MSHRDFDAMVAGLGRPTFTVAGQKFHCRSKVAWKKFSALTAVDAEGGEVDETSFMNRFFKLALIPGDRERFFAALDADDDDLDDDQIIGMDQLAAISEWLMEHYTGKLRESAPVSSDGLASTGR